MAISAPKYFLAANSCEGFVSYFDSFYKSDNEWRIYIIKGGPGTGKSSFMKFMATKCYDLGLEIIFCPCSSDPHSLDGLIIPQIKTAFLDGTSPHIVEPRFPGAVEEIINLGQFWDSAMLRESSEKIIETTLKNKALHNTVKGYLSAAGELLDDNLKLSRLFCNIGRIEAFAMNTAKRYIPKSKGEAREEIRFLGGVTPQGIVAYSKTITDYFENIIIFEDKTGGASGIFMAKIRDFALKMGYNIITLKNPFLPSRLIDHIIIPELSLCFCSENEYIHFDCDERRIHARRFYDLAQKKQFRGRMLFNRTLSRELLLGACETLFKAKLVHDSLEKYYIDAMDFSAVVDFANDLAEEITLGI